jgi:molybdopterin synthase sulfur carrier subunit
MNVASQITVFIPGVLREYCGGASEIAMSAATVRAALDDLERRHPSLYVCICDETRAVRRHVNIFVNIANVRDGEGVATPLAPGDVVTILPAVSGG